MISDKASAANRTHIGVFGKMNAGKSSLINALVRQDVSIVSDHAGTTTDVVRKAMEIHGIGPCLFLDTAGYDDEGELGKKRSERTRKAGTQADLALILYTEDEDDRIEREWIDEFQKRKTPVIAVIAKSDQRQEEEMQALKNRIEKSMDIPVVICSSKTGEGIDALRETMVRIAGERKNTRTITGTLVKEGDSVLLVMPQDKSAPQGRLIQPQAQTIRELLEKHCMISCCAAEETAAMIANMKKAPDLIITDSQVFHEVYEVTPPETKLTSFSILFAAFKGDIEYYAKSAEEIFRLNENSKVLIAECCSHAPLSEDIGRVKIPRMLRKLAGENLQVDVSAGMDFPDNLNQYDLIIQCGGCMFNRKYIISRINQAKEAGVPMTNYGIAIAGLQGILDKVVLP